LLAVSGAAKLHRPATVLASIRALVPAAPAASARALGAGELIVGALGIAIVRPATALVVACAYAGLAVVAAALLRRGGGAPCGCFGERDEPVSAVHVTINALLALSSLAVAISGTTIADVFRDQAAAGVVWLVLTALLACLLQLTMTALVDLRRAVRGDER
jgi:hypothetical protein